MSTENLTDNTTTAPGADAKPEETPSLVQQVSDAEFALLLLKAFPQDRNYMLDVNHFATHTGMTVSAFKKHLQRISKKVPELDVFKATESLKYRDDHVTIIEKPAPKPPRKPRAKKAGGISKSKPQAKKTKNAEEVGVADDAETAEKSKNAGEVEVADDADGTPK